MAFKKYLFRAKRGRRGGCTKVGERYNGGKVINSCSPLLSDHRIVDSLVVDAYT